MFTLRKHSGNYFIAGRLGAFRQQTNPDFSLWVNFYLIRSTFNIKKWLQKDSKTQYILTEILEEYQSIYLGFYSIVWHKAVQVWFLSLGDNNYNSNTYSGYDTKLHLMVRLQFCKYRECGIPRDCYYSLVQSNSYLIRVPSMY